MSGALKLWHSAGMVVCCQTTGGLEWLLIDSKFSRVRPAWEFPKGIVECGEESLDAALRECREETGVTVARSKVHAEFHEIVRWPLRRNGETILRVVDYYLALSDRVALTPDREVRACCWSPTRTASRLLLHKDAKALLNRALCFVEADLAEQGSAEPADVDSRGGDGP